MTRRTDYRQRRRVESPRDAATQIQTAGAPFLLMRALRVRSLRWLDAYRRELARRALVQHDLPVFHKLTLGHRVAFGAGHVRLARPDRDVLRPHRGGLA